MRRKLCLILLLLAFCTFCSQRRGAYQSEKPDQPVSGRETVEREREGAGLDTPVRKPAGETRSLDIDSMSVEELNRYGLLEDIHFEFDRYDLLPQARKILRRNAKFLLAYPGMRIILEGHCDERGTNEYNLALGDRRANSARDYLMLLGVSGGSIVRTVSYGEEFPLDPASNEEAWAKNRRVHFLVVEK